jgi:uncharacterized protein (DUF2062 family)
MWGWIKNKIVEPIKRALKNGISHKRLAVSLALGITIGLIPFYGLTTILVGAVAVALRLDFVIMQAIHYVVHPIQIALFIPFFKAGNVLFPLSNVNLTFKEYVAYFKSDFWLAFSDLWKLNLSAIVVWAILAIPLSYILYYTFFHSIRRFVPVKVQKPFCKA